MGLPVQVVGEEVRVPLAYRDLSGLAPAFLELRRKDIQAVVEANKASYEGLQRVVQRQAQVLKATIGEYRAVAGVMRSAGAVESVEQIDELARGAFRMALDNLTERLRRTTMDDDPGFLALAAVAVGVQRALLALDAEPREPSPT